MEASAITRFVCTYCSKTYQFKDLFENHIPVCHFFYKSRKERMRTIESIETMPSQQELFKLVQHLTKTCIKLEEEVKKLKTNSNKSRNNAIQFLLERTPCSTVAFSPWIKSFEVTEEHLKQVFIPFQGMKEGIQQCLLDRLLIEGSTKSPIRCFKERPAMMYIWSSESATDVDEDVLIWQPLCNLQWLRLIDHISHAFLKAFCEWEENNIPQTQMEKDRNIQFMVKISGSNTLKDKHKLEIRIALQSKLTELFV